MIAWIPAVTSRTSVDSTVAIQVGTAVVAKSLCTGCSDRTW